MDKTKSTILQHMNKDHQRSLALYLRVYCHLSARAAQSPTLTDITTHDLLIRAADGTTYTIPLSPPLSSLSEARPRVVAMHKHCLETLHLSPVVITEYRAPRGAHAVVFAVCLALMLGLSRAAHFSPDSWVAAAIGQEHAATAAVVRPWLLGGLIGAHILEAAGLAVKRLRFHGVEMGSRVWWMWMGSTVIEGMAAWQRIDGMVAREMKKQH